MSYYFAIVSPTDKVLLEVEFGTSKQGGDGVSRFTQDARKLNPFIVNAAIDMVDEVRWYSNQLYLKRVDHFASSHISCYLTPTNVRFLLLHLPHAPNQPPPNFQASHPNIFPPFVPFTTSAPTPSSILRSSTLTSSGGSSSIPLNPMSTQAEEAVRLFMVEVYESWLKAIMSPFQTMNKPLTSPVFKARVVAAGKKFL